MNDLYNDKRIWRVYVEGDKVIKEYGITGGKLTIREYRAKGKNEGRKNATTAEQQAQKEAEASWRKQKEKGYAEKGEDKKESFLPMLAHEYTKHGHKMEKWIIVQPKIDGVRMCAELKGGEVWLSSRTGKEVRGMDHIREDLRKILRKDLVLDGEFFSLGDTFEDICGAFKTGDPDKLGQYHVFDMFHRMSPGTPTKQRLKILENIVKETDYVKLVPTTFTAQNCDALNFMNCFLKRGYEGVMVRGLEDPYYPNKRSTSLLKLKSKETAEFVIKDCLEDKENHLIYLCENGDGVEFKVNPNGEKKKYLSIFRDNIGKFLTVQFQEMTKRGIPRFPVGISVRDYE